MKLDMPDLNKSKLEGLTKLSMPIGIEKDDLSKH